MKLYFSPSLASSVAERCMDRSRWQINFGELLKEVIEIDTNRDGLALADFRPTNHLSQNIAVYLSALLTPNASEDLINLGQKIVWGYAVILDTHSLVQLTNSVFKSLTLSPPLLKDVKDNFGYQCVEINFHLHVLANIAIHSIRRCDADYYEFSRQIDQFSAQLHIDGLPKCICFVFLTENYLENFELWIDVFNASTGGQQHLVIVGIGQRVHDRIIAKLNAIEFANVTIFDFTPRQKLTASGNGEDLYYLWYLKIKLIRYFVSREHDVIYSDLDSFWVKNFIHIWEQASLSDVDIAFMPSSDMPLYAVQKWGVIPCCGFFACRASGRLERFLGRWERWVEVMFDDQIGLAEMLLDAGVEWEQRNDSPDWRSVVWNSRAFHGDNIRLSLLNPSIAKRVGEPNLLTAEGVTIWHPRWNTFQQEHRNVAATLRAVAAGGSADPPSHQYGALMGLADPSSQERETLTALADRYRSDKGTAVGPAHHYTFLYDLLFADARDQSINLLEIGLAVGGPELGHSADRFAISPSVLMWLSYFSRANIFGFDITDFSHMKHPRFEFTRGDCGSTEDLQAILRMSSHFDIIIDDASHASYHQQNTFKELFKSLHPGGFYIIEDLHWQSPFFEDSLPVVPKTWEFFYDFFVDDKYLDNQLISKKFMDAVKLDTYSFNYFYDFTGQTTLPKIIVIKKEGTPAWVKS